MQYISMFAVLLTSSTMLLAADDTNAWNQVLALKNVSPRTSAAVGAKEYSVAVSTVKQLIESEGSSTILKLLGSTSQDDYLRQVTIAGALKASYTYQDLPTLCAVEKALSQLHSSVHENDRQWIESEVAQLRIADWIDYLCRIPDSERIPRNELLANIDSWVQKTVAVAMSHSSTSSDADVLSHCLVK